MSGAVHGVSSLKDLQRIWYFIWPFHEETWIHINKLLKSWFYNYSPWNMPTLSHHKLSRSCSGTICCPKSSKKSVLEWNHNHAYDTGIKITNIKLQVSMLLMYVFCLYPRNVDSKAKQWRFSQPYSPTPLKLVRKCSVTAHTRI